MKNLNTNNYVVIIAGGMGSRFWPESRVSFPKQYIDVMNTGKSLIKSTYDRFEEIVPKENIYIVTTEEYRDLTIEHLPSIEIDNIILEPERKNTAACIGLACYKIGKINPDANILIAPADHLIIGEIKYNNIVKNCFDFVSKNDCIITIGIKPTKPATGYGYIQYIEDENNLFKKVKTFTEKPSLDIAKTFIKSGDFLWNSGMFIWNYQSFEKEFSQHLPEMNDLFQLIMADLNTNKETKAINNIYSRFNNISIDYGMMEKSNKVYVIPADFEWSDVGSWSSLYDLMPKDYLGNAVKGDLVRIYNSSNNLIVSSNQKLIIVEGVEGKCIVDTPDALMILSLDKEQEVKNFTTDLKRDKLEKFL